MYYEIIDLIKQLFHIEILQIFHGSFASMAFAAQRH